jgi:hypothetical protein
MRAVMIAMVLLSSTASADVLGLKFGMTDAQVKAAKPCKGLVANPAKASLTCKAVRFAGTTMAAELWVPKAGLARVHFTTRIGSKRLAAVTAADAVLDKLVAVYGPLDMIAGPHDLDGAAVLFDNVDSGFVRFKGKLASGAMFQAQHASDDGMKLSGKLLRDRNGYAIELGLRPDTP